MGNCLKGNDGDHSNLIRAGSASNSLDAHPSSSSEGAEEVVENRGAGLIAQYFRKPPRDDEEIKTAKCLGILHHLPVEKYEKEKNNDKECVICMIEFSEGDRIRYLPCLHTYHLECIDDWLMRSFTCPSCLEPVDSALFSTFGQIVDNGA